MKNNKKTIILKGFKYFLIFALVYNVFDGVTSADFFVKKDLELLRKTNLNTFEKNREICQKISFFSHVSQGTDWFWMFSYHHYLKSQCYFDLAVKNESPEFCEFVIQKKSFSPFKSGSRYSEEMCLKSVEAATVGRKLAAKRQVALQKTIKVDKVEVVRINKSKRQLKIFLKGELSGLYLVKLYNYNASFDDPMKIVKEFEIELQANHSEPIRIEFLVDEVANCKACKENPQASYTVQPALVLLKSSELDSDIQLPLHNESYVYAQIYVK